MTPGENILGGPEMASWKESSLTTRCTKRRSVVWKVKNGLWSLRTRRTWLYLVVWKVKKWLMISEKYAWLGRSRNGFLIISQKSQKALVEALITI